MFEYNIKDIVRTYGNVKGEHYQKEKYFITQTTTKLPTPTTTDTVQQILEETSSNVNQLPVDADVSRIFNITSTANSVLENTTQQVITQEMVTSNGTNDFFVGQEAVTANSSNVSENLTNFVNAIFGNTSPATDIVQTNSSSVTENIVRNMTEISTESSTEDYTNVINRTISGIEEHTLRNIPHVDHSESRLVTIVIGTIIGILILGIVMAGLIYIYHKRKFQRIERNMYTFFERESQMLQGHRPVILADSSVVVNPALVQDDYTESRAQFGIQESRL